MTPGPSPEERAQELVLRQTLLRVSYPTATWSEILSLANCRGKDGISNQELSAWEHCIAKAIREAEQRGREEMREQLKQYFFSAIRESLHEWANARDAADKAITVLDRALGIGDEGEIK